MASKEEMILKFQRMSEYAEAMYADGNLYYSDNTDFFTSKRKEVLLADIDLIEKTVLEIKNNVIDSTPPQTTA